MVKRACICTEASVWTRVHAAEASVWTRGHASVERLLCGQEDMHLYRGFCVDKKTCICTEASVWTRGNASIKRLLCGQEDMHL